MMKRLCVGIAALAFALITVSTPARATVIYENINLNFGDGYTATGNLTFMDIPNFMGSGNPLFPLCRACTVPTNVNLYFDGSPLTPLPDYGIELIGLGNPTGEPLLFHDPFSSAYIAFSSTTDQLPTTYADFFLNDAPAVGGEVSAGSAVPLPPGLPLFASALLGLACLAVRKSRRSTAAMDG